jgi:tripartite-type tricarboxylate transporter receptor subunit TctC
MIKSTIRRVLLLAIFAAAGATFAQPYPNRTIKIVAPFTSPGASDTVSRLLAQGLQDHFGVSVVVENKPGANGNLGTQAVAKSAADGYTLLIVSTSLVTSGALYKNPGFDPIHDFTPLSSIASVPLVFVVPASLNQKTIQGFVNHVRQHPRELSYGSAGIGNGTHLAAQTFFDSIGADILHVPYKGAPLADLMSGRLQFYAGSPTSVLPGIQDGRLVPLAVSTNTRVPLLPDVPTVAETVTPNFNQGIWYGIAAPSGTPEAIVRVLSGAISKVLNTPEIRAKYDAQGMIPFVLGPQEFSAFIKKEQETLTKVIKASGFKPE